ncbi:MAG: hypothetical protein DRP37_06200 [Thermodesulfobacteriota bacterium]|nr:MAG: hypothetical protein DRP37_06200 [Thermodesulfobacteriota bacterium]
MGRKSTTGRYRGFTEKRDCLLVYFAIFFLTLFLFGCSTVSHNVEWKQATLHLREGQVDKAVSELKPLLNNPNYACKVAFYLFAFDGSKDEYIKIMRSEACKYEMPGEAKLLEEFLSTEEKFLQLKSKYKKQQSSVNNLRKETQNLEKELSRLRFELQKTEEIRRETEEWRIQ